HRLDVRLRAADDPQDFAGGRLLFLRLNQFAVACLELLLRLRQALLKVADPRAVALGRLATNRRLGFLGLRGLWTPAHRPPLASYDSAGDRLGEPVNHHKGTANSNLSGSEGCVRGGELIKNPGVWVALPLPPTHLVSARKREI